MGAVRLRDSFQPPSHPQADLGLSATLQHRVTICHPGYDEPHNVLLILQALDQTQGGFHHETARIACGIIADNRWDGFLSATRDGSEVGVARTDVLPPGRYYFRLPPRAVETGYESQSLRSYPIVPRFHDWRFPHENMPDLWRQSDFRNVQPELNTTLQRSDLSAVLAVRDNNCRLSGFEEGTIVAHICPKKTNVWFHNNSMQQYIINTRRTGPGAINDSSNVMLLREDLHTAFDAHRFTFVPKTDGISGETCLVVHVWVCSMELTKLYHNVAIRPLKGVSVEFLFARFALSVFSLVEGFLQAGVPRLLSVVDAALQDTRLFTSEECFQIPMPPPRSGTQSPKKRGRSEQEEPEDYFVENAVFEDFRPSKPLRLTPTLVLPRVKKSFDSPSAPSIRTIISIDVPENVGRTEFAETSSANKLALAHLELERARSDPAGQWKAEEEWLESAMVRPLCAFELPRLMRGWGYEVLDEDDRGGIGPLVAHA